MSSSLGHFGRKTKRDPRRKRLERGCMAVVLVLVGWYHLPPLLDSPNLSIVGGTIGQGSTPASQEIPWNRLLIPPHELGRMDYFSDSWLMNRKQFLQLQVERMETVEEACFQVIDDTSRENKMMLVDWTDFSVEHLSKWWKNLQALSHSNPGIADQVVYRLNTFVNKVRNAKQSHRLSPFPKHTAIAMIAFQSYESVPSVGPERGHQLTAHSLAATIASLYQVGFIDRIVVGGYQHPDDSRRVHEAFQILESIFDDAVVSNKQDGTTDLEPSLRLGETQVTYVRLEQSWVHTKRVAANIPRGLLLGMQKALRNELSPNERAKWIGSSSSSASWQYFYLTEPDTILHSKPHVATFLKNGLDRGWVFFPHRWQPIPHQADLPNHHASFFSPSRYIPQDVAPFSNITTLTNPWKTRKVNDRDDTVSYCCDAGMDKPGRSKEFGTKMKPCGKWWWACGFSSLNLQEPLTADKVLDLHKRLVPYPMMRLDGGTSVIVAASEMGRRCLPSRLPCAAPQ